MNSCWQASAYGTRCLLLPVGVRLAVAFLRQAVLFVEGRLEVRVDQAPHDADRLRGVENVHGRFVIRRRDAHRRVLRAGRRSADEQRHVEAFALHLSGDVHHFIERRRNQAAQTDEVGLLLAGDFENLLAGNHHPQVDHFVVVAAQDDAHDILADVVHVPFDGGHDDAGAGLLLGRRS